MNRKASKVILSAVITAFIVSMVAAPVSSQEALEEKIDKLFMIASSAELKVRDRVEPAKDSIAALGVDAVPILVDMLVTKSARERLTIIQILTKIGSPGVPYLISSLANPDGIIVQRVCWALGDIGDSSAVEPLTQVTTHQRWQVREEALGALGDIGSHRASEAVISGFSNEVGEVRKAAVVAAGKIGIAEAVMPLVNMLGDNFYGARLSAVEAILKLDTAQTMPVVIDSLSSERELVGDLACYLLGRVGGQHAMETLYNQTLSDSPRRRAHAAVAIINGDPRDEFGFRQSILERETDRLTLLRINSAIYFVQNAGQKAQQ